MNTHTHTYTHMANTHIVCALYNGAGKGGKGLQPSSGSGIVVVVVCDGWAAFYRVVGRFTGLVTHETNTHVCVLCMCVLRVCVRRNKCFRMSFAAKMATINMERKDLF